MVLDAHGLAANHTMARLTTEAVAAGAYQGDDPTTGTRGAGWIYRPLLEYARTLGLDGEVRAPYAPEQLDADLARGHHPIISVHPPTIREDTPAPPAGEGGGHLVLVVGARRPRAAREYVIHNPNAREPRTQERYAVAPDRFAAAFAGRGLVLRPSA